MDITVFVSGTTSAIQYVGWSPYLLEISFSESVLAFNRRFVLRNKASNIGQVVFYERLDQPGLEELHVFVPGTTDMVFCYVAGKFGAPSINENDCIMEVVDDSGNVVAEQTIMVRVRKNANNLQPEERNRFLEAFGKLNANGVYKEFRNMHLNVTSLEAHGEAGFLPWHRAYLLDLERELQNIDPTVALPYWKFDEPAPNLFDKHFIGADTPNGVEFDINNPLYYWIADDIPRFKRQAKFNTITSASQQSGREKIPNETQTINLGSIYKDFLLLEGSPHGYAHVSFFGDISVIDTAARDPLFYLLHANVDRLWAKWQWINDRRNKDEEESYNHQTNTARQGHNVNDTMWPWNGIHTSPRPTLYPVPGGDFAASTIYAAPDKSPKVGDMIDYQGVVSFGDNLGFDYDDVPFSKPLNA